MPEAEQTFAAVAAGEEVSSLRMSLASTVRTLRPGDKITFKYAYQNNLDEPMRIPMRGINLPPLGVVAEGESNISSSWRGSGQDPPVAPDKYLKLAPKETKIFLLDGHLTEKGGLAILVPPYGSLVFQRITNGPLRLRASLSTQIYRRRHSFVVDEELERFLNKPFVWRGRAESGVLELDVGGIPMRNPDAPPAPAPADAAILPDDD